MNKTLVLKIVKAGLIVGTLDILSAFIYYYIKTQQTHFLQVFKFIASSLYGKDAFGDGSSMIVLGIILHYTVAFLFTIFFFLIYPRVKIMSQFRILTGIVYGLFIWVMMNRVIVPMTLVAHRPFNLVNALINMGILIVCIGIPLSFMANAFYGKARFSQSS